MSTEERNDNSQLPKHAEPYTHGDLTSQGATESGGYVFEFVKHSFIPTAGRHWTTSFDGMKRVNAAARMVAPSANSLRFVRYLKDFPAAELSSVWSDTATGAFTDEKIYVVQTNTKVMERCILMATDPGDLVLDATCGSGTTAYVAEQWGRRWITVDTSRVALALARARIMGARYPFYLLADSREGQAKEAEITQKAPSSLPTRGDIRHGFVYERVPHITLKSIANNAEIDVIWDKWQQTLEPLREQLNKAIKKQWQEWEIPREADESWPEPARKLHADWWTARISRQKEIDASIAAKAEFEYLYDKPYEDKKTVRVAGPFTVESLSPHRVLGVDENEELIDPSAAESAGEYGAKQSFPQMILEDLKTAGVQQAHKEDRIIFTALAPWPGRYICAEGRYLAKDEGKRMKDEDGKSDLHNSSFNLHTSEKRAGIFIGPEFGTVTRPDLVEAARECGDANFDVLIACAFNYDAHTSELTNLGRVRILKARMNADLHMSADLKNTGKGNLFVIFGEPDISILPEKDDKFRVKVNGVDVFDPSTGEVRSDSADGIACWFIDTDYNGESFFVRHAYFLGANDPYSSLKTTLKAEINAEAWKPMLASPEDISESIRKAANETPDHKFQQRFLVTEWEQIVDAWQIKSADAYANVSRLGRKTTIPKKQQTILWSILQRVINGLNDRGLITTSELFTKLADAMAKEASPPFDFAVIDEAQDLTVAHLRFFAALGRNRRNSLFFAGDLGQRIFQQPFSWLELDVDIRGRSQNLTVNYRTSHQIRSQSDQLLPKEMLDLDGIPQDRKGTISVFNGPAPVVQIFKTEEEEINAVSDWIKGRAAKGVVPGEFGIFVRSPNQLTRAKAAVEAAGIPYKILDEKIEATSNYASVCTMHLAKGLEFRAVVVMACDDEVIPLQERIETVGDDADLQEVYDTERHLLYVACTRARDFLLVTATQPASEFLDDLSESAGRS
jgi:hypothetical protein